MSKTDITVVMPDADTRTNFRMTATTPIRVLLVDDEPSTHFLHKRVISKAAPGAVTVSAMNGRDAIEYMMRARFDQEVCPTHIWLDLQMPHLDGWSFLEEYMSLNDCQLCNPKITIVTSSPDPRDRERALGNPLVNAYVEKFVDKQQCHDLLFSAS